MPTLEGGMITLWMRNRGARRNEGQHISGVQGVLLLETHERESSRTAFCCSFPSLSLCLLETFEVARRGDSAVSFMPVSILKGLSSRCSP